jgi:ankyrin repeat protein/phage FluMu protein Com
MAIELTCTGCGKVLHMTDASAGKKGKCPACGAMLQVRSAEELDKAGADGFSCAPPTMGLWDAAGEGNIAQVRAHLCNKSDVNGKDTDGQTALHIAARMDNVEMAKLLLAHGASVNEKDNQGKTPIFAAARKNSRQMLELLIAHGADVNARNDEGWTPLHLVACFAQGGAAELLLAHGADPRLKDRSGRTASQVALDRKSALLAEMLKKAEEKT